MKIFNRINPFLQWVIAFVCVAILVLLLNWWIIRVKGSIVWMLLIFIIVPLIQFLVTPLFTRLKLYTYFSPMVLAFGNNTRVIDLHNGTSFDYLLEMRHIRPGKTWEKKMLAYYFQALLNIANRIEEKKLPSSIVIRGSSYFLSDRSATKLGFQLYQTNFPEKVNILFNYLDLVWMYSLSKGRIAFPNLLNIKTIRIRGVDLLNNKQKLSTLLKRMDEI